MWIPLSINARINDNSISTSLQNTDSWLIESRCALEKLYGTMSRCHIPGNFSTFLSVELSGQKKHREIMYRTHNGGTAKNII